MSASIFGNTDAGRCHGKRSITKDAGDGQEQMRRKNICFTASLRCQFYDFLGGNIVIMHNCLYLSKKLFFSQTAVFCETTGFDTLLTKNAVC